MVFEFTQDNIEQISKILKASVKRTGNVIRMEIADKDSGRKVALEINLSLDVLGSSMNMVSVYTPTSFIQLQNVTAFVASDVLEQVTFFGKNGATTTGLIVEKGAGCSLYANVDDRLLNEDFTMLPTEVMMSSVALSLTESEGLDGFSFLEEN